MSHGKGKKTTPTQAREDLLELAKLFSVRRWPEPCDERLHIADAESYPFEVQLNCVEGLAIRQDDVVSKKDKGERVDGNENLAAKIPLLTSSEKMEPKKVDL